MKSDAIWKGLGSSSIVFAALGWLPTLMDLARNKGHFILDWNTHDVAAPYFLIAALFGGIGAIGTRTRLACAGFGLGMAGLALFVFVISHAPTIR
ncbi:MAG: hypothetical protein ACM3VW_09750 [Bacteroidota bacterium]